MERLGLTWKVDSREVEDTRVEIRVGRLPNSKQGGTHDLISIADVGFGVSQTLPVVVALLEAKKGDAVYLEEPEIHLHPRAQERMAEVLADAARRGVFVLAETHSSLLLRGVQTLVARGELAPDLVKLHWFKRSPTTGATEVVACDLDDDGAFGDWPEDFDEVSLQTEKAYLDAVERKSLR
jgi:predicted ATPase